jgi:hypothetical protein
LHANTHHTFYVSALTTRENRAASGLNSGVSTNCRNRLEMRLRRPGDHNTESAQTKANLTGAPHTFNALFGASSVQQI